MIFIIHMSTNHVSAIANTGGNCNITYTHAYTWKHMHITHQSQLTYAETATSRIRMHTHRYYTPVTADVGQDCNITYTHAYT